MTTRIVRDGIRTLSLSVDAEGWASYAVTILVQSDDKNDGPFIAANTPGLPLYGAPWNWKNDFDPWATRRHDFICKEVPGNQEARHFELTYNYRVKADGKNCYETQITDPLLQPMKISGTFAKDKEQGLKDRFGKAINNSAFEIIHGPQNEWDQPRPQVTIQQYVPSLQLELFAPMNGTVNDAPLWGLGKRCWLLTATPWEKQYRGVCEVYFSRTVTFDGRREGWDRDIQDEGTKCLRGHWHPKVNVWVLDRVPQGCAGVNDLPNPFNPAHFQRAVDRNGNHIKVILNGAGRPYNPDDAAYTFQGTEAQAKNEADSVSGAFIGPYASQTAANTACCISAGTGTGTSGAQPFPRQVYISIEDGQIRTPVDDPVSWAILTGSLAGEEWDQTTFYGRGTVVFLTAIGGPFYFIAQADNINEPPLIPTPTVPTGTWVYIPNGFSDKGDWKATAVYHLGDYVRKALVEGPSGTGTAGSTWWCITVAGDPAAGIIRVEKYLESNFLALGIPTNVESR